MPTMGQRLRLLRENKKITQKEFARLFKLGESTISMYERDEREPNFDLLKKFADFYDVSTDYLLGHSNDPTPTNPETQSVDEQLAEIIKNNPDVGMFFKDFAGAPEQRKKEMLRFWRMLELEEKDRKPGDKQGE